MLICKREFNDLLIHEKGTSYMFKMKRSSFIVTIGVSAVVGLSGCSLFQTSQEVKQDNPSGQEQGHYGGDITETTKTKEKLPSFLSSARNDQISKIYEMAVQNQELLESIPCYCGCGEEELHKNNKDCFISEVKENGSVVWDSHAMTQTVCVDIAFQAVMMYQNGASVQEVRTSIDKQYETGSVKPTTTPMPTM